MSITTVSALKIAPEQREQFLELIREGLSFTRSFEGCESFNFYAEDSSPNNVFFIEKWSSLENQRAYVATRIEDGSMERLGSMMVGEPKTFVLHDAE